VGKFKGSNKSIRSIFLYDEDRKLAMSLHDSKLYLWDLEEILINFFGSEGDQHFSDSFAPFRIMDINNSQ